MNLNSIPSELIALPQWVCYGAEGTKPGDRGYKMPYNPLTGYGAKAGQPDTWTTFAKACAGVRAGRYTGIGFEFAESGGLVGIDFDHCRNPETGEINPWAAAWVERLDSYTEISPSGTGLHIICFGQLPGKAIKHPHAEMYDSGRYFTVTGDAITEKAVRRNEKAVETLYAELLEDSRKSKETPHRAIPERSTALPVSLEDQQVIDIARRAKNGQMFDRLFQGSWQDFHKSQSEADLALCNLLAFYTSGDAAQVDRLFRASGLMREKWDEQRGGQTYGEITVARAVADLKGTYSPRQTAAQDFGAFEGFEGFEIESEKSDFALFAPFAPPDTSKLPTFPVECLPPALKAFAEETAECLQVTVDMPAVACLILAALAVQGKFIINPKPGWVLPLNLYAIITARPSERKSPTLKMASAPVYSYTREENERRGPAIEEYKTKLNILIKSKAYLSERASRPPKKGESPVDYEDVLEKQRELDELEEVRPLRLLADDVTPEALTSLLAENGGRMAVVSAEGGIFDIISGRYSDKANMDIFLKAYDGDPVMIDRKGRAAEQIEHPTLTMLLMVQPGVLKNAMGNRDFQDRGFMARFLYSLPKSTVGGRNYETRPISPMIQEAYTVLLRSLLSIPDPEKAAVIHFSPEAHQLSKLFDQSLEPRLVDDLEEIEGWAGKFHGQVMRIAGVLHCCQYTSSAAEVPVSADTIQRAQIIGAYFLEHAQAAFRIMGMGESQDEKDAKYILKRLDSTGMTEISKRDLHQLCKDKSGFDKVNSLDPGLSILIDRGYLRVEKAKTKGRPTERIVLNPEYLSQNPQNPQKVF